MNYYDLITGSVSTQSVKVNEREIAARLKTDVGFSNENVQTVLKELLDVINYKYVYTIVPISLEEDNVNLGFTKVRSKDLSKNLDGCSSAIILASTLGIGVDRYLNKKNLTSPALAFIADALGSAYAEGLCEYVNQELNKEYKLKPRFSPGYGDLTLETQVSLLDVLSAGKTVGITLNSSLLMTPVKSITAIIGVL